MTTVISLALDESTASQAREAAAAEERSLDSFVSQAIETFARLPKELRDRLTESCSD